MNPNKLRINLLNNRLSDLTNTRGEIFLIRHAESEDNINNEFKQGDPNLSISGKKQIILLINEIKNINSTVGLIDEILVSPMKRTLESANYISKVIDIPVTVLPDYYETNGYYSINLINRKVKKMDGLTSDDIMTKYNNFNVSYIKNNYWKNSYNETDENIKERCSYCKKFLLKRIKDYSEDDKIYRCLMIGHGDFMEYFLSYLINTKINVSFNNASLSQINITKKGDKYDYIIKSLNNCRYLETLQKNIEYDNINDNIVKIKKEINEINKNPYVIE